jgi:hypothetical protein
MEHASVKPGRIMFLLSPIFPMTIAIGLLAYMAWLVISLRVAKRRGCVAL